MLSWLGLCAGCSLRVVDGEPRGLLGGGRGVGLGLVSVHAELKYVMNIGSDNYGINPIRSELSDYNRSGAIFPP